MWYLHFQLHGVTFIKTNKLFSYYHECLKSGNKRSSRLSSTEFLFFVLIYKEVLLYKFSRFSLLGQVSMIATQLHYLPFVYCIGYPRECRRCCSLERPSCSIHAGWQWPTLC